MNDYSYKTFPMSVKSSKVISFVCEKAAAHQNHLELILYMQHFMLGEHECRLADARQLSTVLRNSND